MTCRQRILLVSNFDNKNPKTYEDCRALLALNLAQLLTFGKAVSDSYAGIIGLGTDGVHYYSKGAAPVTRLIRIMVLHLSVYVSEIS